MSTPATRRFRLRPSDPQSRTAKALRVLAFLALSGFVAGTALVTALYVYYLPSVPSFASIEDYQPKLGARIYSADNQLVGEFAAERRVMVPFDKIPKNQLYAFVSAEDKRFYSHGGLDFIGMTQAVVGKLLEPSSKLRGASTITQQVAKSLLATHESYEAATSRTLSRKIREAILARRLESVLSKDEIIYMYVHQIFLGNKAYGVQAAAEHYFRKNVWDLTLAEMATLAGLPQRPSDYSPVSNPKKALARRKYVLRRMLEDDYITAEEAKAAMEEQLTVYTPRELYLQIAPYYTEQVRRMLVDRYGERAVLEDGLEVYTALHVDKQAYGQAAIADELRELDKRQGFRGALTRLETRELRGKFMRAYRAELGLTGDAELEPAPREQYLALVEKVNADYVEIDVAGIKGVLPLAGMRWARKPDPTERVDLHYLTDARRALRPGDVILVALTTRKALSEDRYGYEILDTIPKDNELPLFALEQEPIAQAALLSVDPRSGYVVAQVGGYNFEESSFNRAMQACREPGSAFKPIVYSAAIDRLDYTPSTMIDDKPIVFDDPDNEMRWKPDNAGSEFKGEIPMRTCLMESINTPAIRIADDVGIEAIIRNARRLGLTTPLKRELGTALGSSCTTLSDLTKVYVTFNQMGQRRDLVFIRRVVDRFGNVLEDNSVHWDPALSFTARLDAAYRRLVEPRRRALDPQTAFVMVSMLQNVVEGGTAVGAKRLGLPVAAKTGTTNDSFDAWFMGFTRNLVTGVWVGHDKKERPLGVSEQGGRTALPVWVDYMIPALTDYTGAKPKLKPEGAFPAPGGIVRVSVDAETGLLARPGSTRAVYEYYRAGTEPQSYTPDRTVLNAEELTVFGAESDL